MKTRRLVIRVAAVLVLIIIGIIMSIIGRGHTIYLDNKTLEYNGQTYKAPYKVTIYVGDEQLTKLYDKERGSTTCLGQTFNDAFPDGIQGRMLHQLQNADFNWFRFIAAF